MDGCSFKCALCLSGAMFFAFYLNDLTLFTLAVFCIFKCGQRMVYILAVELVKAELLEPQELAVVLSHTMMRQTGYVPVKTVFIRV